MQALREIALDVETTGLSPAEGHRLLEIGLVEMIDKKPTSKVLHLRVNPARDIPARVVEIHGITNKMVAKEPIFAVIAQQVMDFIGTSPIVITCRTDGKNKTLDIEFLKAEMEKAGLKPFPDTQWVNVRRWSEVLFGDVGARLDNVLDHYKIDRTMRDVHGALLDAQLLAKVYPFLARDYASHTSPKKPSAPEM